MDEKQNMGSGQNNHSMHDHQGGMCGMCGHGCCGRWGRFSPLRNDDGAKGFMFTLNQDLWPERFRHRFIPYLPGLPNELQCGKVAEKEEIIKQCVPEFGITELL